MQLASGCMQVWFADSIPALIVFLWVLRFPPTPENRNLFIFLVHSFWFLVVCKLGLNYLCVRCGCPTAVPGEPIGLKSCVLQNLPINIIIVTQAIDFR